MPDAVVDLGKTRCRVRLLTDPPRRGEAAGAPGLGAPDGVLLAADAVGAALRLALADADRLDRLVVGAAGALAAPRAAAALADLLHRRTSAAVAVTSDAITAHLGALGGGPGVAVVAGTGAVAVGLDRSGALALADGLGPHRGDLGGGAWIGHSALRHAAAAGGPLADRAQARYGDSWRHLAADGNAYEFARARAMFVPDVRDAASAGNPDAAGVLQRAAAHLGATTRAAIEQLSWPGDTVPVALVGGLTGLGPALHEPLAAAIAPARLVLAAGSALDGAALMLDPGDLPHEGSVVRRGGHA